MATKTTIKNLGAANLGVIREMLLGNKNIEQSVHEIHANGKPESDYRPDIPIAWLYTRYDAGHPTCVKIARKNALCSARAALQLFVRTDKMGNQNGMWNHS